MWNGEVCHSRTWDKCMPNIEDAVSWCCEFSFRTVIRHCRTVSHGGTYKNVESHSQTVWQLAITHQHRRQSKWTDKNPYFKTQSTQMHGNRCCFRFAVYSYCVNHMCVRHTTGIFYHIIKYGASACQTIERMKFHLIQDFRWIFHETDVSNNRDNVDSWFVAIAYVDDEVARQMGIDSGET